MIAPMLSVLMAAVPFLHAFIVDTEFTLPPGIRVSGEKGWTEWSYCAVSPEGDRIALIDPSRHEVITYDLRSRQEAVAVAHTVSAGQASHSSGEALESFDWSEFVQTIARNGRKPDEVNIPVAIAYDGDGRLLVSDAGNRRLSVFSDDGDFQTSFLFGADEDVPSSMRVVAGGNILCSNLRLDRRQRLNAGHHCNLYSTTGHKLRSMAYTPEVAFERNLWVGVAAVFDVDARGTFYQAFSCDPTIHVYDSSGRELRSFGSSPGWFVPPPILPAPIFELESPPPGFWTSWTRPIGIICAGPDGILRTSLTNGRVAGVEAPFLIDLFSSDGVALAEPIASEAWPVGVDRAGAIYFLSIKGDKLLKTHLPSRERE